MIPIPPVGAECEDAESWQWLLTNVAAVLEEYRVTEGTDDWPSLRDKSMSPDGGEEPRDSPAKPPLGNPGIAAEVANNFISTLRSSTWRDYSHSDDPERSAHSPLPEPSAQLLTGVKLRLQQMTAARRESPVSSDLAYIERWPIYLTCLIRRIYEDANFVAVAKPWDLRIDSKAEETDGAYTVQEWFKLHVDDKLPMRFCHQIDFATSGVLLMAKNRRACGYATRQFVLRTVKKRYIAIVTGHINSERLLAGASSPADDVTNDGILRIREATSSEEEEVSGGLEVERPSVFPMLRVDMEISNTMGFKMEATAERDGKSCSTFLRVLEYGSIGKPGGREGDRFPLTKVELFPKTGRRHQLRVTMRSMGHCILGDMTYGRDTAEWPLHSETYRLCLHSNQLKMPIPVEWGFPSGWFSLKDPDPFVHEPWLFESDS